MLELLVNAQSALARRLRSGLALLSGRDDLRLAERQARPCLLPEPPRLRGVTDGLAVSTFTHHSEVRVGWRRVLRRRQVCVLLVAIACLAVHRQLVPVAVDPGWVDPTHSCHSSSRLQYLVIDQPLLLDDTLIVLYLLLLPLNNVLQILLLGSKVRLLRWRLAACLAHMVSLAGGALRVRGGPGVDRGLCVVLWIIGGLLGAEWIPGMIHLAIDAVGTLVDLFGMKDNGLLLPLYKLGWSLLDALDAVVGGLEVHVHDVLLA